MESQCEGKEKWACEEGVTKKREAYAAEDIEVPVCHVVNMVTSATVDRKRDEERLGRDTEELFHISANHPQHSPHSPLHNFHLGAKRN